MIDTTTLATLRQSPLSIFSLFVYVMHAQKLKHGRNTYDTNMI
jgi:hypothetical protein